MLFLSRMRGVALLLILALAGALHAADRLETTDGEIVVGTFEKLQGGEFYFKSAALGLIKLPAPKVKSLTLDGERAARYRMALGIQNQVDAQMFTRDGKLVFRTAAGEFVVDNPSQLVGINEELPDERAVWDVSAALTFAWTEGNTKTYALGYRFDIKRTTKEHLVTFFGHGSYLQDRTLEEDSVRERRHHFGAMYQYIFSFGLTLDVTEDLYFDEFAGYHWRSITGVGPGYFIRREPNFFWHVALHATYTYEDLMGGAEDRGYFGARARTEIDWVQSDGMVHVNFKSEILFDFDEVKNLNVNSALLVEAKISAHFTAGLLVEHRWDNLPPPGFVHHDFRFALTIGLTWSGRWH
jgi:putative salt-induced outer membrane protein YdiY